MNLRAKDFIEIAGVLGVIATLIFVGVQLMLERRVAIGAAYQERAESRLETLRTQSESDAFLEDMIESFELGVSPWFWSAELEEIVTQDGYSRSYAIRQAMRQQISMVSMDNLYLQRSIGLLEEGYWEAMELIISGAKKYPFVWEWYRIAPVSAEFKEYISNF